MRPVTLLAIGTIAYAAFLATSVPATVIAPRIEAAAGGQIAVVNPGGSLVEGSASLDVRTPAFGTLHVDELRWRWRPALLLSGRFAFDIEARVAGFHISVQAARTIDEWQLRDLRGTGEASAIAALVPLASTWQPSGALTIESAQFSFDGRQARGDASAEWRDASLSLSTAQPVGSWRATLVAEGGPAKLMLTTVKGPLQLAGKGTLAQTGKLDFQGEARAEPGRETELDALLDRIGPRRADGARTIEIR